jgi:hypothetical protein
MARPHPAGLLFCAIFEKCRHFRALEAAGAASFGWTAGNADDKSRWFAVETAFSCCRAAERAGLKAGNSVKTVP